MEQLLKKLFDKSITLDKLTDEDIYLVTNTDNNVEIARAVITSSAPAENLDIIINVNYYHGFDWGYPRCILPYFSILKNTKETVHQKEALLNILYSAIYMLKYETINQKEAFAISKKFFPKEEQKRLKNFFDSLPEFDENYS